MTPERTSFWIVLRACTLLVSCGPIRLPVIGDLSEVALLLEKLLDGPARGMAVFRRDRIEQELVSERTEPVVATESMTDRIFMFSARPLAG